jgi:hypothetical protein
MPKLGTNGRGGRATHGFDSLSPRTFSYAPALQSAENQNPDYYSPASMKKEPHSDMKALRPSHQHPLQTCAKLRPSLCSDFSNPQNKHGNPSDYPSGPPTINKSDSKPPAISKSGSKSGIAGNVYVSSGANPGTKVEQKAFGPNSGI